MRELPNETGPLNGKEKHRSRQAQSKGVAQPVSTATDPNGDPSPAHIPERKCILTGAVAPRAGLIRLALGPDGTVAPDVNARAPGRGAWIGVDRKTLETAITKGRLKGGLLRAFKVKAVEIPADLPQRIEDALQRATLDRLGLEARAGNLLTGSDKISEAARRGMVSLLLHAADAAEDGSRKLDQALRVGSDAIGSGLRGLVIPADRSILSIALGRENVVHIAIIAREASRRVYDSLSRWRGFIGCDDAGPCEAASQGQAA